MMFRTIIVLLFLSLQIEAKQDTQALKYLNEIRNHSGLTPLRVNTQLGEAAKSHASYLVRQQKNGHFEKRGWKGYTGKTPSDRVVKAGYLSKMVMENVTVNSQSFQHSIDTLFAAIYHRFVFLNFDKDEIGLGSASTKKSKRIHSAFIYNIGSSEIAKLCKGYYPKQNGFFYMQNLCKDASIEVPEYMIQQIQSNIRAKNSSIILYPYKNATDISPVFYTESPHPLPGSKVSGFPISVQFNPSSYTSVTLKKFRLYDDKGKEITKRKIVTQNSDKNNRFGALEFAFMPLKRLKYGTKYHAVFEAIAEGKKVKKSWYFTTKKPKGKLYTITKKQTTIKVKKGDKIILYFEPKSNQDILGHIKYWGRLNIKHIDKNTISLTIPKPPPSRGYSVSTGGMKVVFK
ncbi:MAG: CAP domain-containing protein [Campylobacterota bacterium]|nr:CAP domain-containing protein [Campylobacterota bacterium]